MSSRPILFIGDSLSVGTSGAIMGAAKDVGVEAPALTLPGKPGGRRAVDVTPATARAWRDDAQPSAVWLALGTNDLADDAAGQQRGWTAWEALVREAASWGLALSVGTVPPLRDRVAQAAAWSAATRKLAGEVNARLVPLDEAVTLGELPDGVHPNGEGYRRFGRLWLAQPAPLLAGASTRGGLALAAGLALLWWWTSKKGR